MKILLAAAGLVCVLLGIIGIFLPLMPTTPFLLLALFCFARSSERLHSWLLHQRLLGPLLKDWEQHRIVPLKAKLLATVMLLISFCLLAWQQALHVSWLIIIAMVLLATLALLWHFPSNRRSATSRN